MNENLGRVGKDRITGFEGTATGYVQYLTGCHQFLLVGKAKPDGGSYESQWFDEQRVDFSGEAIRLDNGATPGCDREAPKR